MNMNNLRIKTISILLLLGIMSTLSGMAFADEDAPAAGVSETIVIIPPDGSTANTGSGQEGSPSSGTENSPVSGTENASASGQEVISNAPAAETGTAGSNTENQSERDGQVVILLPDSENVPTPENVPIPVGPGTETAGSEATPASPSPSPTPQTAGSTAKPTVTKDPTDETVDEGGECVFIADYTNAIWAVWHFVSPDGKTDYRFDDKALETAFPGLKVENGMYSNMTLKNIPAALNGWRVCCEYRNNNGSVRTNYATVTVRGSEQTVPEPTPSAEPTPAAEPTPTPTPTPTPAPSETVVPPPAQSETPEETPAPKSTEKHSGSHTLLKITIGFAVAAVVICGGILLIYRRRR